VRGHGWAEQHYLLADLIDAVQAGTAATYRTVAGRRRVPNPRRYPRPGDDAKRGHTIGDIGDHDPQSVVTYLDSLKPKGA
jgi:hypothetical protein